MRTTPDCIRYRAPFTAFFAMVAIASSSGAVLGATRGLDADIRQQILDCTYEVISPLRSAESEGDGNAATLVRVAGTASCFGNGQLVTAAHVFEQVLGGRFEAPIVRDRRGNTYPVNGIVHYSTRDDFVVFTAEGLETPGARPHNTTGQFGKALYLAWRRGDRDIVFDRTDYRGRSSVETLGRDGWIEFGPAPGHGASGAAVFDDAGRVVGIINSRASERPDAHGFAVPVEIVAAASDEWADIAMRDPLRVLGMPSDRNMPLVGGIPLPAPYERFEKHTIEVRKIYFAHTLPYSLGLSGDDAPLSDELRISLCEAMAPGYCTEDDAATLNRVRLSGTPRGCSVTWQGVGVSLVRCRTRPSLTAARIALDVRAQLAATSLGRRFAQAPPAPCTSADPLEDVAASDTFTDHTGAEWKVRAWPVQACDWVMMSMSRALPDGTLTLVRGAPSAFAEAAIMQLKALTAIQCAECGNNERAPNAVIAGVGGTQNEVVR